MTIFTGAFIDPIVYATDGVSARATATRLSDWDVRSFHPWPKANSKFTPALYRWASFGYATR
ncbi:MAG: hypothetical protein M3R65_05060 [Gemmatimonadota bacterium]|nr:hypothetical protein [Gemmatimonadota bacterium]